MNRSRFTPSAVSAGTPRTPLPRRPHGFESRHFWLCTAALLSLPACSAGGADDASDDSSVGAFATPGAGAAPASASPGTGNPPSTNPNANQPGPAAGTGGSGSEAPGSNVS